MAKKIITTSLLLFLFTFTFAVQLEKDSVLKHLPKSFSGQVFIQQNDSILLNYFQGYSNRIYGDKITDSTVFNLGENAHSFVYHLIHHLVRIKQIKHTDQVSKYIPEFPYKNILVRHLINHQSGLPSSYVKFYYKKKYNDMNVKVVDKAVRFDNDDIIALLIKKKPKLEFTPGDSTSYSDMNYLILSSLIEKVTFTPFKDFTHRFFDHQNFGYQPIISAENDTLKGKAYGYRIQQDSSYRLCENLNSIGFNFSDGTNGNQHLYLSAKNLSKWGAPLFQNILAHLLLKKEDERYYGNFKYNVKLNALISKGAFGGTYSYLIYFPSSELNIAITSNVFNQDSLNELLEYLRNVDNR